MVIELEFFGKQHRHGEVDEQGKGDEPGEEVFHGGGWLEGFAAPGVGGADGEECDEKGEEKEVDHGFASIVAPIRPTGSQRTVPRR
jgi:hypothetical protein